MTMELTTKLYKLNDLFFEFNYDSDVGFFLQVTYKFRVIENLQYEIEKNNEDFYRGKMDKNKIENKKQQRKLVIAEKIGYNQQRIIAELAAKLCNKFKIVFDTWYSKYYL